MRTIRESTNNRDYNLLLHPWYALTLTYKHQSMDLQEMVMTGLKFICPKLDNACGKWELHPELTKNYGLHWHAICYVKNYNKVEFYPPLETSNWVASRCSPCKEDGGVA